MHFYLYKITNNINNKIYVGIHQTTNIDDGYFGSGLNINRAIKKYGKENFTKEILEFFNTEVEMSTREKEIVNKDFINLPTTYNIAEGGYGSFSYINSLPNQGHKPGQQLAASLMAANKLKNDPLHRAKVCSKRSINAKKQVANNKCVWQVPDFINPATYHKWISNDAEQKSIYVPTNTLDIYFANNWYFGRKYKSKKVLLNNINSVATLDGTSDTLTNIV